MKKDNLICIVQARLNSSRFPNKVTKKILGKTVLEIINSRLKISKSIKKIIFAIPNNKENSKLKNYLKKKKYSYFCGSEKNVLSRYYFASKKYNAEYVLRVTSDCPLVSPNLIDKMFNLIKSKNVDYISNTNPPTFPDGFDLEIFKKKALDLAYKKAMGEYEKEHVTPYLIKKKNIKKINLKNNINLSQFRLTLDTEEDLNKIKKIFNNFKNINISGNQILNFVKNKKEFKYNCSFKNMGTGQKMWIKAKKIIPDGGMLLSKRAESNLPNLWPSYYKKAKGCFVWDLDNKKYIDFGLMGVGTNVLGYNNLQVNQSVKKAIDKSNMSTLNSPEEISLAEKLIQIHPWASMVKFARTGGEANSIAIRIARAFTNSSKVAICGYHGWHDWYLAANISNKRNLKNHLMNNLNAEGVPKSLSNTVFPFEYNDFIGMKRIINREKIKVIKMEVKRHYEPKNNFLKKVRNYATKNNIILIFDECTTGFREVFGGLHKKYKINPDLAIFGKALGNGFAITAIIGKKRIMEKAKDTFISSTFWTERSGSVAALKTIELMEKGKSWKQINKIGKKIKLGWRRLSRKYNLDLDIYGSNALPTFCFKSNKNSYYLNFITGEMLKRGFLFKNTVYVSISHNKNIIKRYFNALEQSFKMLKEINKVI